MHGIGCSVASVSVCVHAVKGKQLELSTPKLVHIYSVAVARHALGRSMSHRSHGCCGHSATAVSSGLHII